MSKYRNRKMVYDNITFASRLECDFYILPSSLHEIILMREDMAPEMETLREMVQEINSTQVLVEDYLSDSIYYYDRNTKEVTIVE